MDVQAYDVRELNRLLAKVPELEHVATHDFRLEMDRTIPFDGEILDSVLILRRRWSANR